MTVPIVDFVWMLGIAAGLTFLCGVGVLSLHEYLARRQRLRMGHFGPEGGDDVR